MRTTLTIDDHIMNELKALSQRRKMTFKEVVNLALRRGLSSLQEPTGHQEHRSPTFSMGYPPRGSLDKALALAYELEDEEVARKLQFRK